MAYNDLTPEEAYVILEKGTEAPFSGALNSNKETGVYTCKQCNTALFDSESKFDSGTGWPSFDDDIAGAVKRISDSDGHRVEIVCATCGGHLGHVFEGERITPKSTRHCVNSLSLNFIKE
ncbi:methionine-R-sulfoxide reductase [Sulfurimonas sp. MAG313]|nr:methionine-R-sulfoxide reductase [Sulfurimonas sp. MAG313]MDF1881609.1 methionine-R-sulfoxide reductase [Sulfurimonas sp. MAG313]